MNKSSRYQNAMVFTERQGTDAVSGNYHEPSGDIRIKGPFADQHFDEILGRVRRIERKERATRPVEQIVAIRSGPGETDIATSGTHLARRIGEALRHSYKGELSFSYGNREKNIHVVWER
jgi:hypothetical protein